MSMWFKQRNEWNIFELARKKGTCEFAAIVIINCPFAIKRHFKHNDDDDNYDYRSNAKMPIHNIIEHIFWSQFFHHKIFNINRKNKFILSFCVRTNGSSVRQCNKYPIKISRNAHFPFVSWFFRGCCQPQKVGVCRSKYIDKLNTLNIRALLVRACGSATQIGK